MNPSLSQTEIDAIVKVLLDAGERVCGPLSAEVITSGRSNLTFRLTDGQSRWILRTPPRRGRTQSAHDVGREFRVMAALNGTAVPVPRAIALCEEEGVIGGPFALVEFVDGVTIQTRAQLAELTSANVASIAELLVAVLASLHRLDHRAIGLEQLGRPDAYAARQLRRWTSQWAIVGPEKHTVLAAEVVSTLAANVPGQAETSVVHGDFRIDNTLIELAVPIPRVSAVLDWELSTIGDPVADVALMCAYRHPAFDLILGDPSAWTSARLPDVSSLAGMYESARGVTLQHWEFHLALAYFKIGVIAAGIDHRYRIGGGSDSGSEKAGQAVEVYLDLALRSAGGRG